MTKIKANFRTSSRIPLLLGEDLIPEPGYALFELVKNSHDADASSVEVVLKDVNKQDVGSIIVSDDGDGMSLGTIQNVWLVIGTPYKRNLNKISEVTGLGRPLLGEKGIGRFAVHKLGERITLITRTENGPEYVVEIDWNDFDPKDYRYLEEIPVDIISRTPKIFKNRTGTWIKISGLREPWTRGMVRDFHRDMVSISSPFKAHKDFRPELEVDPQRHWLDNLFSYKEAMKIALFNAAAIIEGASFSIKYGFNAPSSLHERLESREVNVEDKFPKYTPPQKLQIDEVADIPSHLFTSEEIQLLERLGKITIRFYMFDLDRDIIKVTTDDQRGLKRFLKENGGMRVYRNRIRVFGLGGVGEDWLDLGGRRVQVPSSRLGNNQFFGAVSLSSDSSKYLKEQTNRRGFTENIYLKVLRKAVRKILLEVEGFRFGDKERIKAVLAGGLNRTPVLSDISDLKDMLLQKYPNDVEKFEPVLNRLQKSYEETRDTLINAASMGLSLGAVVHEVEKQMSLLTVLVKKRPFPTDEVKNLVYNIDEMMKGVAFLLRKRGFNLESLNNIVDGILFTVRHRFRKHNIELLNGFLNSPEIRVRCSRRLVANAIINLIDNSIFWLSMRGHSNKKIYIGPSFDYDLGPAIIVADNGPGFIDPAQDLVRPFFSRKEDGMGLGLYIVEESMRRQEGAIIFSSPDEVDLPAGLRGAVVALVFNKREKS